MTLRLTWKTSVGCCAECAVQMKEGEKKAKHLNYEQ